MGFFSSLFGSKRQNMRQNREIFLDPLLHSYSPGDFFFSLGIDYTIHDVSPTDVDVLGNLVLNYLAHNESILGIFLKSVEYNSRTPLENCYLTDAALYESDKDFRPMRAIATKALIDLSENNRGIVALNKIRRTSWWYDSMTYYKQLFSLLNRGFDFSPEADQRFGLDERY